jgi:hypothetical protein
MEKKKKKKEKKRKKKFKKGKLAENTFWSQNLKSPQEIGH